MSGRVRVYELARELGLSNKELLGILHEQGIEAKSHSSSIDAEDAELVREHVLDERKSRENAVRRILPATTEAAEEGAETEDLEEEEEAEEEAEQSGGEKEIHLKPPVIVRDLAEALGCKPNELIADLMTMNVFAAINQVIEPDVAAKLCERRGYVFIPERRGAGKKRGRPQRSPSDEPLNEATTPRPPVVAFLGHVDHGKTTLQDAVRKTNVAAGEEGGITQAIGASVVRWHGQQITFIDTPGHEAFTAMRARGANATDIVVLVVAADDGIMPQTIEAINHARAAKVPIVVALNKMDLPSANPDRVLVQLQEQGLMPEDWGGEVGVVPVSAKTGDGIDDLLERILLEAEMMELKGNPDIPGKGVVLEAQLERGKGPTATVLVRNGSVHVGDPVLCGTAWGRVRALFDHRGKRVKSAGPSTPVKVMGLSDVPPAGEQFFVVESDQIAKERAQQNQEERRSGELTFQRTASLEAIFQQIQEQAIEEIKFIIKADTQGSVEAIRDALAKIESDKIRISVIHAAPGEVTENDVLLASASHAIILGFHVRAMPGVNKIAKREGVEIRLYGIIYELMDQVREAIRGRIEPEKREIRIGTAEIRRIFMVSKAGKICGCLVQEGVVRVNAYARVRRGEDVIYNGTIKSLRHYQDDVREVNAGQECGIRLDNFEDFEVGDVIEVLEYEEVEVKI